MMLLLLTKFVNFLLQEGNLHLCVGQFVSQMILCRIRHLGISFLNLVV